MKTRNPYFIFTIMLVAGASYAQQIDQEKLVRMRDSLDNLLMVNPTASAILVKHREVELYSFSSFLGSTRFNDKQGNNANFTGKQILFNSLLQANYGISKNRRANIGLDISYRAYRFDPDEQRSLFSVFENKPDNTRSLSYAGPRLRVQPFKRLYNFTYQSYLWFPIAQARQQAALGSDKINWGHTFFYYRYFNRKIGLFLQANVAFAFPGSNSAPDATTEFYMPLSLSLSYVVTRKDIFFGSLSYSWINNDSKNITEGADSDFIQGALGYQRIVTRRFFLNVNYNTTLSARNYGVWNSFNFGLRYLF